MIRLKRPCCISIVFIIVVITVEISISNVSHFGTAKIKCSPRKMEAVSDTSSLTFKRKRSNTLRSMKDNDFLGSWLKLMNTKEGVWLTIH